MAAENIRKPGFLGLLPDFLFALDDHPARYVGRAWLLALIPSLVLSAAMMAFFPGHGARTPAIGLDTFLLLTVIIPPLETFLMAVPLLVLPRLIGAGPAVLVSGFVWGAVHSLDGSMRALIAQWPFLIMSIAFLTWYQRGFLKATLVVSAIHALQNSVPVFMLLVLQLVAGTAPAHG